MGSLGLEDCTVLQVSFLIKKRAFLDTQNVIFAQKRRPFTHIPVIIFAFQVLSKCSKCAKNAEFMKIKEPREAKLPKNAYVKGSCVKPTNEFRGQRSAKP